MGVFERISVDVPASVAALLRASVQSGRYANEGEAITAAVQRAEADDHAVSSWLHDVVVPICTSVDAGTATLLTLDEARARLKAGR